MSSMKENDDRALQEAMIDAIEGVGKDTGAAIAALRRRARSQRRVLRMISIIAFVLVVMLAGLIMQSIAISHTVDEVDQVQHRTSADVLCPLYGVFLASDTPAANERALKERGPQGAKERLEAFKVIREGAKTLGCDFTKKGEG